MAGKVKAEEVVALMVDVGMEEDLSIIVVISTSSLLSSRSANARQRGFPDSSLSLIFFLAPISSSLRTTTHHHYHFTSLSAVPTHTSSLFVLLFLSHIPSLSVREGSPGSSVRQFVVRSFFFIHLRR